MLDDLFVCPFYKQICVYKYQHKKIRYACIVKSVADAHNNFVMLKKRNELWSCLECSRSAVDLFWVVVGGSSRAML